MKKLLCVATDVTTLLSGSAMHETGEFLCVRSLCNRTLAEVVSALERSLGGFSVISNTRNLSLTFCLIWRPIGVLVVELLAAAIPAKSAPEGRPAILQPFIICRQH